MGRRLLRNDTFWLPRMPNTEAESVDDIVAASSSEGSSAKCMLVQFIPDNHHINKPVTMAVTSTPAVDSIRPGRSTGRMSDRRVPMPPENNITHRAIMPMN